MAYPLCTRPCASYAVGGGVFWQGLHDCSTGGASLSLFALWAARANHQTPAVEQQLDRGHPSNHKPDPGELGIDQNPKDGG